MPKSLSLRSGLSSVLFWSIISAAFIGPGSVTACTMAGSKFGLDLLWVLTFATFGTVWVQEAAARITIATGRDLGQTIVIANAKRPLLVGWLLFGAIFLGCAAYQAGNILGAVNGLVLLTKQPSWVITAVVGVVATILLAVGSTQTLANFLGVVVLGMGGAFAWVAFGVETPTDKLIKALVVPIVPDNSLLLINSLIGTTIVPYNLFFGSSIVPGTETERQSLSEMRLGLWVAVLLGGFISVVLLIAGLLIPGDFSFTSIATVLSNRLGTWAGALFAFGLFAAGFASTLTAPLAAAVTAQSLLGWERRSPRYHVVWGSVMAIGLLFSLTSISPVAIIVAVQAVNGILLPVVVIFLWIAVNNRTLLTDSFRNSLWQNLALGSVVAVSAFFGVQNVWLALQTVLSWF